MNVKKVSRAPSMRFLIWATLLAIVLLVLGLMAVEHAQARIPPADRGALLLAPSGSEEPP